jgi:subtilisin family serine protease
MAYVLVAIILMVTLLCGSAIAAIANNRRMILMFDNPPIKAVFDMLKILNITVKHELTLIDALAVQVPSLITDSALQSLPGLPEVYNDLLTQVDPICPTTVPPLVNIEHYPWGQLHIRVEDVHEDEPPYKGSGVRAAILDTGIVSHIEFVGRIATGYNAIDEEKSPFDNHGHGTHMAGIIAADLGNSASWIIGAAPLATLVPVKVLDDTGDGYLSDLINGLDWVGKNNIRLVNMSFGFLFSNPGDDKPLEKAIKALHAAGIIMVASAGNCAGAQDDGGGDDCEAPACAVTSNAITAPAKYQEVIAVGATDINDMETIYSASRPKVDVLAPGGTLNGQILSTNKGISGLLYGLGHGTSQAAAHVTGAVALALQVKPNLTPICVRNLLQGTAVAGTGLIDVKNMIDGIEALCP